MTGFAIIGKMILLVTLSVFTYWEKKKKAIWNHWALQSLIKLSHYRAIRTHQTYFCGHLNVHLQMTVKHIWLLTVRSPCHPDPCHGAQHSAHPGHNRQVLTFTISEMQKWAEQFISHLVISLDYLVWQLQRVYPQCEDEGCCCLQLAVLYLPTKQWNSTSLKVVLSCWLGIWSDSLFQRFAMVSLIHWCLWNESHNYPTLCTVACFSFPLDYCFLWDSLYLRIENFSVQKLCSHYEHDIRRVHVTLTAWRHPEEL